LIIINNNLPVTINSGQDILIDVNLISGVN